MGLGAIPRADGTIIQDRPQGRGERLCLSFCPEAGQAGSYGRVGLRKGTDFRDSDQSRS
jgi:hypothetical protein